MIPVASFETTDCASGRTDLDLYFLSYSKQIPDILILKLKNAKRKYKYLYNPE